MGPGQRPEWEVFNPTDQYPPELLGLPTAQPGGLLTWQLSPPPSQHLPYTLMELGLPLPSALSSVENPALPGSMGWDPGMGALKR